MKKTIILALTLLATFVGMKAQNANEVLQTAQRTNNYFMQKYADPTIPTFVKKERSSNLWTRAVYYEGLMALYEIDPQQAYADYTDRWADFHNWTARNGVNVTNADDQCCQQTYIERFIQTKGKKDLSNVQKNLDHQIASGRVDYWWWIDAIQMALPVYAEYSKVTGNRKYIDYGMKCYRDTRDRRGLFNTKEGYWWRDSVYKAPYKEPDGKNCYWSRGNGWVYAALVRTMSTLSASDPYYKELRKDFMRMSEALVKSQRQDGYWNASLVSSNYAGPEITGTALFLYGMSWGIRQGMLSKSTFKPVCDKAWKALQAAVHTNGFLGYNQGSGAGPQAGQPVTYTSIPDFEDYGTGCFLLGATEYYKLLSRK